LSDCCSVTEPVNQDSHACPRCGNGGKKIEIITLKSLLLPEALPNLTPEANYRLCLNKTCDVVYFNQMKELFLTQDIKVPVYQKTDDEDCPVCYCFGWTRRKLKEAVTEKEDIVSIIAAHMKAGKCGCNVNNPQGSCCLGNVKETLELS
jgi:hypothetical protein